MLEKYHFVFSIGSVLTNISAPFLLIKSISNTQSTVCTLQKNIEIPLIRQISGINQWFIVEVAGGETDVPDTVTPKRQVGDSEVTSRCAVHLFGKYL